jgi:hypothetical protein
VFLVYDLILLPETVECLFVLADALTRDHLHRRVAGGAELERTELQEFILDSAQMPVL